MQEKIKRNKAKRSETKWNIWCQIVKQSAQKRSEKEAKRFRFRFASKRKTPYIQLKTLAIREKGKEDAQQDRRMQDIRIQDIRMQDTRVKNDAGQNDLQQDRRMQDRWMQDRKIQDSRMRDMMM